MADEEQTRNAGDVEGEVIADGLAPDPDLVAEGTGPVAEEAEVAEGEAEGAAPAAMAPEEAEVIAMADPAAGERAAGMAQAVHYEQSPGPEDDSPADRAHVASYEAEDPEEEEMPGVDLAVVVVILLIVIACLGWGLYSLMTAPPAPATPSSTSQAATAEPEVEEESMFVEAELPEGVAARVNGVDIYEKQVNDYIAEFRGANGLEDDASWAQWMILYGYDLDSLREAAVSMFARQELIDQAAEELGVTVTPEDVDEVYEQTRSVYETEEEWQEALALAGMTEESFREQCESTALQTKLAEHVADEVMAADDIESDALQYVQSYYPDYAEVASLDEVPEDVAAEAREAIEYFAQQQAYSDYMTNLQEESELEISPAPKDAPYSVFLLPYYFTALFQQAQAQSAQLQ